MIGMRSLGSLVVGLALVAACGGDDGTSTADRPDLPPVDAGDEPFDAEPPDAEPHDAAPPDAEPPDAAGTAPNNGYVLISEATDSTGDSSAADAVFKAGPLLGTPLQTGGGCERYGDGTTNLGVSAGAIAITGTTAPVT